MFMKTIMLLICLIVLPNLGFSKDRPSDASVKEFLRLSEMDTAAFSSFRKVLPNLEQFIPTAKQEYIDLLLPIYQQHLTKNDIEALNAFMRSSAKAHYDDALPEINKAVQEANNHWEASLQKRLIQQYIQAKK